MNGLLFYWIGWIFWIIVTFLMDKSSTRTFLGSSVLILIIASNYWLNFGELQLNMSLIILIFCSLIYLTKIKNWILCTFRTLCLLFGYVGILFWEQVSPVWMFLPRELMIPLTGIIILLVLSNNFTERSIIWCLGISFGEVLHGLIINSYGFSPRIGDFEFLDLMLIGLGMLVTIQGIYEIKVRVDHLVQLVEKQKKRWTHE